MNRIERRMLAALIFALAGFSLHAGGKPEVDPSLIFNDGLVEYAHDIAVSLTEQRFMNSELGGRTSGSEAEWAAADWLTDRMREIGLKKVAKVPYACDTWQFNGATLTVVGEAGDEATAAGAGNGAGDTGSGGGENGSGGEGPAGTRRVLKPYAYASGGTPEGGVTGELLYLGTGTAADYVGVDAVGKIILIDIDMDADWWIEYPTIEAALNGAAAIVSSCSGGYATISDDAMNAQDFCGPVTIPSVNISRTDAAYLKGLLAEGPVTVNLVVVNIVKRGGTGYNITGIIPGKNQDEFIVVGDHYDVHFLGFQDNTTGVAMTLAIAKGMIDAGYRPERTIVFILHGGEEWGAIDTRYDWSIGAWNQVNRVSPEWPGKALCYINFEHPAHRFGSTYYVKSAVELSDFLNGFYDQAPDPGELFSAGFAAEGSHLTTWTDAWSYNLAGIPSFNNGGDTLDDTSGDGAAEGSGDTPAERPEEGMNSYYHSQFDTPDTWDPAIFGYNLRFFIALTTEVERTPALEINMAAQVPRLLDSVDDEAFAIAGIDPAAFRGVIKRFGDAAAARYDQLREINRLYHETAARKPASVQLARIRELALEANSETLQIFAAFQKLMYRLDWGDSPVFGHEQPQADVMILSKALDTLSGGTESAGAQGSGVQGSGDRLSGEAAAGYLLDELLWRIDDSWYSYSFSRENVQYHRDQVFSEWNRNNLYWGTGMIVGVCDLHDVITRLMEKNGTPGADYSSEIEALSARLSEQEALMRSLVNEEAANLLEMSLTLERSSVPGLLAEARTLAGSGK